MSHILSVLSGKGGVGKTLITASLGILLAKHGHKTLLIDCDMGLRNLDLPLGVENDCLYNVWDLAQGKCFEDEAVISPAPYLYFLSAAQNETWDQVEPSAITTVLEDIKDQFDFIILDCPAGMNRGIAYAEKISDMVIAILGPSFSSLRNVQQIMQHRSSPKPFYVLMNQFSAEDPAKVSFSTMLSYVDEDSFCGVIPYSRKVDQMAHQGKLLDLEEHDAFSQALECVLHVLLGGSSYPMKRWNELLSLASVENKRFITPEPKAEPGPLPVKRIIVKEMAPKEKRREAARMNYKWRRRR